ncbi:unnamed protein product, partial [marine sediment metagenome]
TVVWLERTKAADPADPGRVAVCLWGENAGRR